MHSTTTEITLTANQEVDAKDSLVTYKILFFIHIKLFCLQLEGV